MCRAKAELLEEFIEKELLHFNSHGSPMVCLLCDCRPFESPEAMMVHAVGQHCHGATPDVCPLCEAQLGPDSSEPRRCDIGVQHVVLDRHLQQVHLPQLEVIGRMFHSFGDTMMGKNMVASPKTLEAVTRSYRCCFRAGRAAGEGPAFPFEHWLSQRSRHPTENNRINRGDSVAPDIERPSRNRARRACLYDPHDLYLALRAEWFRNEAITRTSIHSILTHPTRFSCAHIADSMPKLIAHVVGCHGGNPLLKPGLRETVQKNRPGRRTIRHSSLDVWSEALLNKGMFVERPTASSMGETLGDSGMQDKKMLPIQMARSTTNDLNKQIDIGKVAAKEAYQTVVPDNPSQHAIYEKHANRFKKEYTELEPRGLCCRIVDECDASQTISKSSDNQATSQTTVKKSFKKTKESVRSTTDLKNKANRLPSISSGASGTLYKRLARDRQQTRNRTMWRQLLPSTHGRQENPDETFCHLCLEGPMESSAQLTEHLEAHHLTAYAERLVRVIKRGTFAQAVDPMRTCFQCYRVLDSFIALQVHIICAHNSMYPFVCGLCHMPYTKQGYGELHFEKKIVEAVKLAAERAEGRVRECLEANGFLKDVDVTDLLPKVDMTANASTIYQSLNTGLERGVHIEEIREVHSAVAAGYATLQMPAAFLIHAIKSHERKHVQQIRDSHFRMPAFIDITEDSVRKHHDRLRKQTMPQALIEFSTEYRKLNKTRMDYEYRVLVKSLNFDTTKPLIDFQEKKKLSPEQKQYSEDEETIAGTFSRRMTTYFKKLSWRPNLDDDLL